MKTIVKCVILITLLAISMPAQGEVLVYSKTIRCQGAEVLDVNDISDVYVDRIRGFLILEVTYDPNTHAITSIDDAIQVEYANVSGDRLYNETTHDFDVERFVDGNLVVYSISESSAEDGDFSTLLLQGRARSSNADPNEVANSFDGYNLYHAAGDVTEICHYSLRLHRSFTRQASELETPNADNTLAIVEDWLEDRGYTPTVIE